ncbi:MAG TPA: hypothetical protein VFR42_00635 [Candidatus Acidoferrum sp.]|nr:hypothetical protein [Candidatus Acidoferrum sp.]
MLLHDVVSTVVILGPDAAAKAYCGCVVRSFLSAMSDQTIFVLAPSAFPRFELILGIALAA